MKKLTLFELISVTFFDSLKIIILSFNSYVIHSLVVYIFTNNIHLDCCIIFGMEVWFADSDTESFLFCRCYISIYHIQEKRIYIIYTILSSILSGHFLSRSAICRFWENYLYWLSENRVRK